MEGKEIGSGKGEGRKRGRGRKKGEKAGGGERGRGERWFSLFKGTAVQDFFGLSFLHQTLPFGSH